ncbi:autophagy protein 13 [Basidiobolus ranarum]|uniref:Autophagy-related protein 13 n=1 Tax=Basidiobolus ranarum TaxID=34480 RepID=A0ABR2WSD2_9FUNG
MRKTMNRTLPVTDSPPPSSDYAPSVASTAASYSARHQRCEQIVQNFYTKVTQTLLQARISNNTPIITTPKKVNKWFNLELEDHKTYKTELKYWRTACLSTPSPSPMILEVYLDASELNHRQILVLNDELMQKVKVDVGNGSLSSHLKYIEKISKKQTILLESWQLFLIEPVNSNIVDLPIVYKKSIVFFRSLFTYVRQLPAYRLFRRLRKMKLKGLKLGYRLTTAPTSPENEIGIDTPISDTDSHGSTSSHAFDPIDTPLGSFVLNVKYRLNCNFCVEDPEAVLSSKFTTTDKEYFLTSSPTEMDSQLQEHSYGSKNHGSLESRGYRISRTDSLRSSHGSTRIKSTTVNTSDDCTPKTALSSTPRTGSSFSPTDYDVRRFSQPPNQRASPSISSIGSRHYSRAHSLSSTGGRHSMDIYENGVEFDRRVDVPGANQIPPSSSRRPVLNQASSIYSRSPSSRPSLSLISPFKSPSLISSPASVHETSASPSLINLRKKNSSTSLNQHYVHSSFSRTTATPPPLLTRASTSTTKLASSFGNRFISESSRDDSRSSQGIPRRRRTTSLLSNDGIYDANGRSSRPQSRASVLTNQLDEDDVGEFVKLIDDRAPLKMFDVSNSSEKRIEIGEFENSPQYSLARFHQMKRDNSFLSESILASSTIFSSNSEAVLSQSQHSLSDEAPETYNNSLKGLVETTSEEALKYQCNPSNIKSCSLSMPNSYVSEYSKSFEKKRASTLKQSKSMDILRSHFDTESSSEIEEFEEGKAAYRLDVDKPRLFNNTDPLCW